MSLKTSTRSIDGMDVSVTQLPARKGLKLAGKLGRVIAPVLSHIGNVKLDSDLTALAPALTALFSNLDDRDYDVLLLEILCMTAVVTQGVRHELTSLEKIDFVFGGDMPKLVRVCAYALEVNFGDFIAGGLSASSAPVLQAVKP